ncbi:CPBP family intramembrane glutamic endopeptidase [Candidatus Lokiarchaeum ossiferum]
MFILMDVASSNLAFLLFSVGEIIFVIIPMIVFKLQKKDLKYEFRHRIIPNEMLTRSKYLRFLDILIGISVGILFYFFGGYLTITIRKVIVETKGEEYYETASEGSVNTTPPPPESPNNTLIWFLIIIGVVIMFCFVALSEEFCFRGVLQKEFGHISPILGILLSSFFFMIYHVFPGVVPWVTFLTFWLYYLAFGILLALITYFQKGDLVISIIAHGTFNSILWVQLYLPYLQ